MGNKRKARIKEERGITLMALIITIIVLVILAAITISVAYTSGIIQMGTQGAKDYANSAVKENEILNETTAYVENVVKNIKRRLGEWEYFEEKDTVNGEKGDSNNPTIPAGFRPINTDKANWGTGEESPSKEAVNNGLVIEDEDGNQFVWVPCYVEESQKIAETNYPKYEQYTYTGGQETDAGSTLVDSNGWRTLHYRAYSDWEDNEAKGYGEASVKQYGGFWIGRYEAGIPEDASFYPEADDAAYTKATERNVTNEKGVDLKPVSKAGYFSWNYISQENAKEVSKNMYKENSGVDSYLVDSYAWDTVMKWFESTVDTKEYVTKSTGKGNYDDTTGVYNGRYAEHLWSSHTEAGTGDGWIVATKYQKGATTYGLASKTLSEVQNGLFEKKADLVDDNHTFVRRIETPTGANDSFAVKNIYDMAGNMWELTTETGEHNDTGETFVVIRGGDLSANSVYVPTCFRQGATPLGGKNVDIGFRVVLYVK